MKKLQKDTKRRVVDPVLINKLQSFVIKSKVVSLGEISGKRRSSMKGYSLEFLQHREYSKGDDLRFVDWRIFGKRDKFYVKEFEAETTLRACIFLDVSNSMNYKNKFEYASIVASTLSYLMLINNDIVDLSLIHI